MNPLSLLSLCLVASSSLVTNVNADLYQLVLYSSSEAALTAAEADSAAILQDWIDEEPTDEGLVAVLPGETFAAGGNRERSLQVNTCPSSCSNSGSNYCRALGCAFCGRCGSRYLRRAMESAGQSHSIVESRLNAALAPYCTGADPACQLFVKILKVNGDGTTDELV